jgi:hypothetical protein
VPQHAAISCENILDAVIETFERHEVSLVASESGSPARFLVNATTFTNNAG